MMAQFTEVLFAQPKQRRAVELSVAAHVIIRVRMQFLAVLGL